MTAVQAAVLLAVSAVVLGAVCGWLTYIWLGRNAYEQGRLDERRESQLTAAGYTASVPSATWNAPEIPVGRHRSPNWKTREHQLVERHITATKEAPRPARSR